MLRHFHWFEALAAVYRSTQRNIPEQLNVCTRFCEIQKPCILQNATFDMFFFSVLYLLTFFFQCELLIGNTVPYYDIIIFMKRHLGLAPSPRTGSVRPINLIYY